jgi:hypothetical protein
MFLPRARPLGALCPNPCRRMGRRETRGVLQAKMGASRVTKGEAVSMQRTMPSSAAHRPAVEQRARWDRHCSHAASKSPDQLLPASVAWLQARFCCRRPRLCRPPPRCRCCSRRCHLRVQPVHPGRLFCEQEVDERDVERCSAPPSRKPMCFVWRTSGAVAGPYFDMAHGLTSCCLIVNL